MRIHSLERVPFFFPRSHETHLKRQSVDQKAGESLFCIFQGAHVPQKHFFFGPYKKSSLTLFVLAAKARNRRFFQAVSLQHFLCQKAKKKYLKWDILDEKQTWTK